MSSDDVASDRVSTEILEKLIRTVDTSELSAWSESPIDYDVGAATVRDSVFGKLGLPVVWEGEVLIGSQIVDAEKIQPRDGGRLMVIDLTPLGWPRHKALAAALGELTAQRTAYWDDKMLAELVTSLHDQDAAVLEAAGWGGDEIQELLDRIEADESGVFDGAGIDDEVPDVPDGPTVCQLGDVWQLGRHTLVVGDSTDAANYPPPETVALLVTDPPYVVSYADKNALLNAADGGDRSERQIANDHMKPEETQRLWIAVFKCCEAAMAPGAAYYVTGAAMGDLLLLLLLALKEAGLPPRHGLVWLKNNHVLGFTDYNYKHEPITYGWKEGGHKFYGDGTDKSVWEIDKPSSSKLHPTMKPVELYEKAIRNSSQKGELVLEPFAGSGTAILACESTGRTCHAIELDPHYADVICARFQRATSQKPARDGVPHDFSEAP